MTELTDIDPVFSRLDELLDNAPSLHDIEHHRLLLVAARRRRELGLEVPQRMVAAERMAAAGSMAAPVLMAKVRDALDGPMLVMKGAEVAHHYPDPALRSYGDLDLIVPDAERSQQQLLDAGFELCGEAWVYEGIHHLRPLRAPGLPLLVELHHEPKWIDRLEPPAVHELLELGVPAPHLCDGVLVLPPAPHALVMAAHTWGHYPLTPLRDLLDIALVARIADSAEIERSGGGLGPRARLANHLAGHGLPVRRRRATWLHAHLGPPSRARSASARCWSRTSSAGWPASGRSLAARLSAASEPPWPTTCGPRARSAGAPSSAGRAERSGGVRSQIAPRSCAHSAIRGRAMRELRLQSSRVDWREVEGELIALARAESIYLAGNASAAVLWRALAEGTTETNLRHCWCRPTASPLDAARADVSTFLADLGARGLLEAA